MIRCDLDRCNNVAIVLVHFRGQHTPRPYCRYHAFDKKGNIRWKAVHIGHIERIGR